MTPLRGNDSSTTNEQQHAQNESGNIGRPGFVLGSIRNQQRPSHPNHGDRDQQKFTQQPNSLANDGGASQNPTEINQTQTKKDEVRMLKNVQLKKFNLNMVPELSKINIFQMSNSIEWR
jgi:hypothetical protein